MQLPPLDYASDRTPPPGRTKAGGGALTTSVIAFIPLLIWLFSGLVAKTIGGDMFAWLIAGLLVIIITGTMNAIALCIAVASLLVHWSGDGRSRFSLAYVAVLISLPGVSLMVWMLSR